MRDTRSCRVSQAGLRKSHPDAPTHVKQQYENFRIVIRTYPRTPTAISHPSPEESDYQPLERAQVAMTMKVRRNYEVSGHLPDVANKFLGLNLASAAKHAESAIPQTDYLNSYG